MTKSEDIKEEKAEITVENETESSLRQRRIPVSLPTAVVQPTPSSRYSISTISYQYQKNFTRTTTNTSTTTSASLFHRSYITFTYYQASELFDTVNPYRSSLVDGEEVFSLRRVM